MNDMDTLVKAEDQDAAVAVETAEDAVQDAAHTVAELGSEAESLVNSTEASVEPVVEAASEAESAAEQAAEAVEAVQDEVASAVESTTETVAETVDAAQDEVDSLADTIASETAEAVDAAQEQAEEVVDSVAEQTAEAVDAVQEQAEEVVDSVAEQTAEAVDAVQDQAEEVVDSVAEQTAEAVDAVQEQAEDVVDSITDEAAETAQAVESVAAEAQDEAGEEVEDEIDFATASMADLVDDFQYKPLKSGDVRDGVIVSISPSEILVDVGAKSEGFVHQREMERMGKEYLESLNVGDQVVVYVVRPEDRDGNIVLSMSRAQQERDWREAEALLESGEIFESSVIGFNRGGVICRVGKVRGFIPASQLVTKGEPKADATEENRYAGLVGKSLWLKVVELDRKRNRLILSERLAMRERRRSRKDELLSELKKGDVRSGRISSLAKFGAFVDLGGADGLIHLSELSWSRVNHPSEVVQVGDKVEVYVLNVDRDRKRIGLSLRRLEPEPWSVVHDRYSVGQVVEGIITKLASFGAFARVDGTLEGLIHISELANHRVTHPREVVKEGDTLNLRIIRIDPARRRMGLSLKRVAEEEYAEVDWRAADVDDDEDEGEGEADWTVEDEA